MELWYSKAVENKATRTAGAYMDGVPFRGVLHTTESTTFTPRSDNYGGWHQSYPHFTLVERSSGVTMYQHIPIDTAARALRNERGGVLTNHARAIQIEIVGRAARSAKFSNAMLDALSEWMRWVEAQTGVKRAAPLKFWGGEAYGTRSPSRMTNEQWLAFDSWCGHQHVPENSHWDPGHINIGELLRRGDPPVVETLPEADETSEKPEAAGSSLSVTGVKNGKLLDVLSTAGTGNPAFQLAHDAVGFRATGRTKDVDGVKWLEISAADQSTGWISSQLVAPTAEAGPTYAVVRVESDDVLNIRTGPGVKNPVAATLPFDHSGATLTGRAQKVGKARWVQVAITGWVNSSYLEKAGGSFESVGETAEAPEMDPLSHGDIGDEV